MTEYDFDVENMDYDDTDINTFLAFSGLSVADRIIMLLYAETQSLRKTAKILGVSYATTRKTVNEIRKEIKNNMEEKDDVD